MGKIMDRAKGKVTEIVAEICRKAGGCYENDCDDCKYPPKDADRILSIKELAVVDRRAELPRLWVEADKAQTVRDTKEMMLKAGYVLEVKE